MSRTNQKPGKLVLIGLNCPPRTSFWGTPLPEVNALWKEGNITCGSDIAVYFFLFFQKESRHSLQGNVLGLLLPTKCRWRRLQSPESSSARTAMARSWATLFCLCWVVITSSCDFCEGRMANPNTEEVRRLGFRGWGFDVLQDAKLARANDLLDGRLN